jgi:hypothetical protein
MFGFVQLQGSQLLKFWPETRSNNLISPNISEHVRTLFGLFVCPTTEHSLPLSIERKNYLWDHLGGRRKEDCVPRRRPEWGRTTADFFGIFFGKFWVPRMAVSGRLWEPDSGSQNQRRHDPAAYRVKVMGGEGNRLFRTTPLG